MVEYMLNGVKIKLYALNNVHGHLFTINMHNWPRKFNRNGNDNIFLHATKFIIFKVGIADYKYINRYIILQLMIKFSSEFKGNFNLNVEVISWKRNRNPI